MSIIDRTRPTVQTPEWAAPYEPTVISDADAAAFGWTPKDETSVPGFWGLGDEHCPAEEMEEDRLPTQADRDWFRALTLAEAGEGEYEVEGEPGPEYQEWLDELRDYREWAAQYEDRAWAIEGSERDRFEDIEEAVAAGRACRLADKEAWLLAIWESDWDAYQAVRDDRAAYRDEFFGAMAEESDAAEFGRPYSAVAWD